MSNLPHVNIYTDGACSGNPGPGGWAALLRFGLREKELSGGVLSTTNNRMEMTAALEALKSLKTPCKIDFFTDSEYLRNGITKWMVNWKRRGWKTSAKKPVKNQDLWKALDRAIHPHQITWHWVRGHTGHRENERVDKLARQAVVSK
ncbi:MAG: ribonuclease HI [Chloroflexi bacterium]|nr:ribonuclease HI [Chloroflexota bacterium]